MRRMTINSRRTPRFIALILALGVMACLALAGPAPADAVIRVGLGDQNAGITFPHPLFKRLGIRRSRIVAPWNAALRRGDRIYLDQWLTTARANRVEPFVNFGAATGSRCPRRPCRLPTVGQYIRAFRAFRRRWPFVRVISPWNEANHRAQPTFRRPKRAAQYFNVIRRRCRGCTILAADVIDEQNMVSWLKVFKRTARGERAWGLHNYRDTNPRRKQVFGGTRKLLRTVRGQVWFTEAGGIVRFVLPSRRTLFRHNEGRASRATARSFRLARRYRSRVKRVYLYNWLAPRRNRRNRFDSGLLRSNGQPRPGYRTVQRHLRTPLFAP
jgi:hypothetical protein